MKAVSIAFAFLFTAVAAQTGGLSKEEQTKLGDASTAIINCLDGELFKSCSLKICPNSSDLKCLCANLNNIYSNCYKLKSGATCTATSFKTNVDTISSLLTKRCKAEGFPTDSGAFGGRATVAAAVGAAVLGALI